MVGIEVPVVRIHPTGNDNPAPRIEYGSHDRCVTWPVAGYAHERLDDATSLDFVVVLADDPFLTCHIQ